MNDQHKAFYKRKWFKYGLITAIIAVVGYFMFFQGEEAEYVLAEAVKGDIVQTVSVTGSIKADPSLNLHFQKTGTVQEIYVEEGEEVSKGDLLAVLENDSLSLEVARMQANLDYAIAQYNQTQAGAKAEEILIAEANVLSAQAALAAAEVELENTKSISDLNIELTEIALDKAQRDYDNTVELAEKEIEKLNITGDNTQSIALTSAYNSAKLQIDALLTELQESMTLAEEIIGVRGSAYFHLSNSTIYNLKNEYYDPAQIDYKKAIEDNQNAGSDPTEEEIDLMLKSTLQAADKTSLLLLQIGTALEKIPLDREDLEQLILDVAQHSTSLSATALKLVDIKTTILTLKTGSIQDIETLKLSYQVQIDQADIALKQAEHDVDQAILNAETAKQNAQALVALKDAAYESAKAMLSLKRSPARSVDLAPLSAQISQAEIALKLAQNALGDSQLYAPIKGVITFIHGKVGENIALTETSLSPFLSIQADNLIVEANAPETDVVKLEIGDEVEMTIDAFDFTEKLTGEVIYIDRAETIIQGVIYYEIKTAFDIDDPRLKSGMTANLEIITDRKEDVLIIPTRALKYENSSKYVEVLNGGPKKIQIKTGLESDQYVEITDGLKEGDKIITFVK